MSEEFQDSQASSEPPEAAKTSSEEVPNEVPAGETPGSGLQQYEERLRQAEAALRGSEEHLRMVVDGARDYAIFMVDTSGYVLTWNTGAERMKQWKAGEIIGQHFRVLYRPEDQVARRPEHNLEMARGMDMYEETYPRRKKDGSVFIADVVIHPIYDPKTGSLRGFAKVVRDVTERQLLLQRLVTAQENERRRLSRELHDETGQHLAALSLGLKSLENTIAEATGADSEPSALLLRLRGISRDLARDLHRVAVDLRPTALDDLGLVPALYGYVERWSASMGISTEFDTFGFSGERLPELVETTIYRVVQEALTNVARHANGGSRRTTRVGVALQRFEYRLQVTIEDDGPGFDVEAAQKSGRLGLAGMRERAAACGATLEIESAPGEGTTVFLRIPAELLRRTDPAG